MLGYLFLTIASILLLATCSDGSVIQAQSGSSADIQTALTGASDGDTVRIPAGNFTFSGSAGSNAGIVIMGAGPTSTILTKSGTGANPFFTIDGSNGKRCIITGIGMAGDQSSGSTLLDYGITLNNGCRDFRIYNCSFTNFGWAAIRVNGHSRGVIDQCLLINNYRHAVGNYGYGVVVFGDADSSWARPLTLGSADAVFVEDCSFTGNRHDIASNNGSRYVFRHNRSVNAPDGFQSIDAHGLEYGSPRGSRSYEIYNDTIDNASGSNEGIYIRGGDGVLFNNTIVRGTTIPIKLTNRCDGTGTNGGYPSKDQIRELYVWNNTYQGSATLPQVESGFESMIQLNRDYFNIERPGYAPYAYPHPLRTGGATAVRPVTPSTENAPHKSNGNARPFIVQQSGRVFSIFSSCQRTIHIYNAAGTLLEIVPVNGAAYWKAPSTGVFLLKTKEMVRIERVFAK